MIGRSISNYLFMLAKQLRVPKPKPPPNRFKLEVFRRIWARKDYVPEGGWPGKADFIEFNMWDYIYHPPKGNKYGLKTHKVFFFPFFFIFFFNSNKLFFFIASQSFYFSIYSSIYLLISRSINRYDIFLMKKKKI